MSAPFGSLYLIFILWIVVTWQRYCQALTARWLGDLSPRSEGRESLNPMKHIDLFGTIIIPLIGILMIGDVTFELVPLFGWGKRLEYDSRVLRNGAKSEVVLGAVGIVSLVFVAALVAILGKLFIDSNSLFYPLMGQTVFVAVFLAVLNLVPLPPLEGWTWLRVLMGWHRDFERMYAPWIFIVFIIVMNFTPLLFVIYGLSKALFLVLV